MRLHTCMYQSIMQGYFYTHGPAHEKGVLIAYIVENQSLKHITSDARCPVHILIRKKPSSNTS